MCEKGIQSDSQIWTGYMLQGIVVNTYIHTQEHIHMDTDTLTSTCMYVYVYIYMYVSIYMSLYESTHVLSH